MGQYIKKRDTVKAYMEVQNTKRVHGYSLVTKQNDPKSTGVNKDLLDDGYASILPKNARL